MSESVLALQKGFDFQAKFFWYKACHLYRPGSTVVSIAWEISETPGFDDVALFYEPAKRGTYGDEIQQEFYQVKFHVDHAQAFSCDALITPEFIGATSESLLQKLYKNYKNFPDKYPKSLYHLVNTWGLDRNDELINLIDNNGAIILKRLFDGTGDTSKRGNIRKKWREHLGLTSDDELNKILKQLRIIHNAKAGDGIDEDMNFALVSVGLQPQNDTKRTSPYADLIRRLHAEKRNRLNRDELKEILMQEQLWVTNTTEEVSDYRIGVRTFVKGTDTIEFETDEYLCLLHYFEERYVRDHSLWKSDILPALQVLADKALIQGRPVTLHLDTHLSAAFTMGYLLPGKTGIDIGIVQKGRNGGRILMRPDHTRQLASEDCWEFSECKINEDGQDTVLAISVTHDVTSDVKEYVHQVLPSSSRILNAIIRPNPSGKAIRDSDHILQAIEQLIIHIGSQRTSIEKQGTIHLFIAAPNTFAFFLGQSSRVFGKITLYEFDFEKRRSGTYEQAITLP